MTSATVLFSGGIDSAACAYLLKTRNNAVSGIFVDFGQAAAALEYRAASALSRHIDFPLKRYVISGGETLGAGELPGRNAFLAFAALLFTKGRSGILAFGIHGGTPYYDCSEPFVASINRQISEHTDGKVNVIAPFISWNKKDVFDYFCSSGLPLSDTYSCEAGLSPPCRQCASCKDREQLGC